MADLTAAVPRNRTFEDAVRHTRLGRALVREYVSTIDQKLSDDIVYSVDVGLEHYRLKHLRESYASLVERWTRSGEAGLPFELRCDGEPGEADWIRQGEQLVQDVDASRLTGSDPVSLRDRLSRVTVLQASWSLRMFDRYRHPFGERPPLAWGLSDAATEILKYSFPEAGAVEEIRAWEAMAAAAYAPDKELVPRLDALSFEKQKIVLRSVAEKRLDALTTESLVPLLSDPKTPQDQVQRWLRRLLVRDANAARCEARSAPGYRPPSRPDETRTTSPGAQRPEST